MSGTAASPTPARPALRRRNLLPAMLALTTAGIVATPILVLGFIAVTGSMADWPHLARTVLPASASTTVVLLAAVGVMTASMGTLSAWLVMNFDFPGRRILSWALVLPLAVPAYLAAYAWVEFLDFTGPVQTALRSVAGFQSARDYWFPDIRSTGGAAVVMASVLYPYVYLAARVVFLMQARGAGDVARTLGAGPLKVALRVTLPMARPAIIAGVALALMETLNDIGAVEYLGVQTMTFAVYSTWLNRGSLEGAAQLACVMMLLVVAVLALEQWARRRQRFATSRTSAHRGRIGRIRLDGWRSIAALTACALPVIFGFLLPVVSLGRFAIRRPEGFADPQLLEALGNTIAIGLGTATIAVVVAFFLAWSVRTAARVPMFLASRVAATGYAVPGTILALGLLFTLAWIDNRLDALVTSLGGEGTGLLITGTPAAIIIACTIRFLAVAEGTVSAGFGKLSPHLDHASRALGHTAAGTLRRIIVPLMRPALLTAAAIVFVDTAKELSATILLRPFGFNTLATYVYENASRARVEDAAPAALVILAVSIVPALLAARSLADDRQA